MSLSFLSPSFSLLILKSTSPSILSALSTPLHTILLFFFSSLLLLLLSSTPLLPLFVTSCSQIHQTLTPPCTTSICSILPKHTHGYQESTHEIHFLTFYRSGMKKIQKFEEGIIGRKNIRITLTSVEDDPEII